MRDLIAGAAPSDAKERDEYLKKQAEAQIAQQDHIRCQSYGKTGSEAYLECRSSLKKQRAEMHDGPR